MSFPFDLSGDKIRVLDVGARVVPGQVAVYQEMSLCKQCHVIAVDPDCSTNEQLLATGAVIHNVALGNGDHQQMNICKLPSCSSLLEPNVELLSKYSAMEFFYRIVRTETVKSERLDDFFHEASFDFLVLDVQGYELEVLAGGENNLANIFGVHAEVA
ncbi:FkbM family methyltransferase, partial [Pseudomonas asplenii]|uniref:FkbM family methyltransferase n=1 Tax=Pseudomonas asplenii TaxID=53407 RepID=UPI0012FA0013